MIDSRMLWRWIIAMTMVAGTPWAVMAQSLPMMEMLPVQSELPNPLRMFNGDPVVTREQWRTARRPELQRLFQHYMYGQFPPAPQNPETRIEREDQAYFGGKATKKELTIRFGPAGTPPLNLLVVVPNGRTRPAPVFVGLNFCGNHTLVDDPTIPVPELFTVKSCPGCVDGKPTAEGRGGQKDVWALEQSIDRGYAVATCCCADIDPDRNDFTDGVHPYFRSPGSKERGPHDWGTIAAWAWGLSRCVDYLVTDRDLDKSRIVAVGHSRLGKTALLAGAFDERIALVIPHQAGTGGSSPSRKTGEALERAESVKRINTSFPHWFCDEFKQFNDHVDRLPFDQHCLVALCAPRPVLMTNATEDQWADPDGQFRVLQAAEPVYHLLGTSGLKSPCIPPMGTLSDGKLGYFIRPGKHSMTREDWLVFLDYADRQLPR